MHKNHYITALCFLPFVDCLGIRIGITFLSNFVEFMKENGFHFYYFFFLIGLICCLVLWAENRFLWNKIFGLDKDSLSYWILAPGLATGVISTWEKKQLVFDCFVLCY